MSQEWAGQFLRTNGGQHVVDAALAAIIDSTTTAGKTYICEALPGSEASAAVWRISRLTTATGVIDWADGNGNFDNVAADRATLTYS